MVLIGTQHNKTGKKPHPGPRAANPIGNPKWPGETSSGGTNWIGYLISEFNRTLTLAYGFANSGAVVDPRLITPNPSYAPCYEDQIRRFEDSISRRPEHAAWNAENAVAAIWFGVNDIRLAYTEKNLTYFMEGVVMQMFDFTGQLHKMGLRQFVFIEVPRKFIHKFILDYANKRTSNRIPAQVL
ncbi:hypothetical protein ACHAPT_004407 [Fusarium lateritium]